MKGNYSGDFPNSYHNVQTFPHDGSVNGTIPDDLFTISFVSPFLPRPSAPVVKSNPTNKVVAAGNEADAWKTTEKSSVHQERRNRVVSGEDPPLADS